VSYFERALLAAALVGVLAGVVGTVAVLRSRVFFAQALSHATFPGAIFAAIVGVDMLFGAGVSVLFLIGTMALLGRLPRQGVQVATGVVLTAGFSLGMVMHSLNPQIPLRPEGVLVGSVLFASDANVTVLLIALALTLGTLVLVHRPLLYSTFDPEGFRGSGGHEWPIEGTALTLIAFVSIVAIPVTGSLLTIALIAGPPATARLIAHTWVGMIIIAPALGAAVAIVGILLSRAVDVSPGGMIAVLSGGVFLATFGLRRFVRRFNRDTLNGRLSAAA